MCWFGDEFERIVGVPFLLGHRFKKNVLKLESKIKTVVIKILVEDLVKGTWSIVSKIIDSSI